jgi:hypothetical protein
MGSHQYSLGIITAAGPLGNVMNLAKDAGIITLTNSTPGIFGRRFQTERR